MFPASDALGATTFDNNGLGDRLQQTANGITTTFTMNLARGLIQVLDESVPQR